MPDHYIQRKIIAALVEQPGLRFAELQPEGIEGNHYNYHLHQLIKDGLVEKLDDGRYDLTAKGKLVGIHGSESNHDRLLQAHSIILIAVREGERWLLRRRLVQPMHGQIGFIHGEPEAGLTVAEVAAKILSRRTGFTAKQFEVKGSGFITGLAHDQIESYVHFVLVEASELTGELIAEDAHGENFWAERPDFSAADMIGSMPELARQLTAAHLPFFAEITLQ